MTAQEVNAVTERELEKRYERIIISIIKSKERGRSFVIHELIDNDYKIITRLLQVGYTIDLNYNSFRIQW